MSSCTMLISSLRNIAPMVTVCGSGSYLPASFTIKWN
uniref:Uncharacterized protein n=1 Tax=Anopheles minimus TaxID=112268 RepID=A0A182WNL4_9DIPT